MKNLFLSLSLTTFLMLSLNLKASEFTLKMYDNSIFDITFNNNFFNKVEGSISFNNVSPGKQYLKVFKYRTFANGYVSSFPKLVFEGIIHIKSGSIVYAIIDGYGRYIVEQEHSLYHNPYNPSVPPVYIPPYMDSRDFSDFKETLSNQSFESSKLSIAKQVVSTNFLTSRQVFEVMELFSFESSKLDFAKYAYPYVYDPNKYYIVNNAFTFSSSISSLDRYILSFH